MADGKIKTLEYWEEVLEEHGEGLKVASHYPVRPEKKADVIECLVRALKCGNPLELASAMYHASMWGHAEAECELHKEGE